MWQQGTFHQNHEKIMVIKKKKQISSNQPKKQF